MNKIIELSESDFSQKESKIKVMFKNTLIFETSFSKYCCKYVTLNARQRKHRPAAVLLLGK